MSYVLFSQCLLRYFSVKQHTDSVPGYRRRSGDCRGGDIGGVPGVTTATSCGRVCGEVAECVSFVFARTRGSNCYLKMASCLIVLPKDGATTYDIINISKRFYYSYITLSKSTRNDNLYLKMKTLLYNTPRSRTVRRWRKVEYSTATCCLLSHYPILTIRLFSLRF